MSDRARLGDHVDILTGFPFKSANYTNDPAGIRLLRGDNVAQGTLRWDGVKRWPTESIGEFKNFLLQRGDTVIAMDRPWIEAGLKFAYLKEEDVPSLLVQRVACLRAKPSLNQRFLSCIISSGAFTAYVRGVQTGTAVPHISAQQIADFTFAMPLKRVQDAIAEVFGVLDDKIAINERIADAAFELGSLCYERSCINASTVREFMIGDIADIFDGPHATPKKTSDGPWFLSISSLKRGQLDLSESAHISEKSFTRWTRRVTPQEGDVLFSYETRLGEAALMPPGIRGCLGRRMALMRPRQGRVDSIFLLYSYLRPEFQETIRRRAIHGATVDRIPLAELPSWRIRILDSDQHRPLANLLHALLSKMVLLQRENDTLRELRDTLLPKLVAGELRIRDAEKVVAEAV